MGQLTVTEQITMGPNGSIVGENYSLDNTGLVASNANIQGNIDATTGTLGDLTVNGELLLGPDGIIRTAPIASSSARIEIVDDAFRFFNSAGALKFSLDSATEVVELQSGGVIIRDDSGFNIQLPDIDQTFRNPYSFTFLKPDEAIAPIGASTEQVAATIGPSGITMGYYNLTYGSGWNHEFYVAPVEKRSTGGTIIRGYDIDPATFNVSISPTKFEVSDILAATYDTTDLIGTTDNNFKSFYSGLHGGRFYAVDGSQGIDESIENYAATFNFKNGLLVSSSAKTQFTETTITLTPETSGVITTFTNQDKYTYSRIGNRVFVDGVIGTASSTGVGSYFEFDLPIQYTPSYDIDFKTTIVVEDSGVLSPYILEINSLSPSKARIYKDASTMITNKIYLNFSYYSDL